MTGEGTPWYYANGFRVLVSRTEIRLVWLQDKREVVALWLPRAVVEALLPALEQALAQQDKQTETAQAAARESETNAALE